MGLREDKKQQLRADLATAAIGMFLERGYETTTVEDIATAVGVSPRTVFRYFATKDDMVVELLRSSVVDLRDELAARPPSEPLLVAVRAAVHQWIHDDVRSKANMLLVSSLLRVNPRLRARVEEDRRSTSPALVEQVAQRLGVDADRDPRPRVVVTLVLSVMGCAIERWSEDGGNGDLDQYVDEGFTMLELGLPLSCTVGAEPQAVRAAS